MVPRCVSAKEAAEYVGVRPGTLLKHGPAPIKIGTRKVYDLRALDKWIDDLRGHPVESNENLTDEQQIARDKAAILAMED